MLLSCSWDEEEKNHKQDMTVYPPMTYVDPVLELSPAQESAFDALNTLQTSTDEMNRLYSTFANVHQPCYPADTSFVITQSEFLTYMKQFVSQHCKRLSEDTQDELATTAVLAQEEYTVFYCSNKSPGHNFKNGLPMSGTWVMPNVLGRRDVVIVW